LLLLGHFLRGGDFLLGDIGQLIDLVQALFLRGGGVGAVQRIGSGLEFQRRAGGHRRIALRRHEVAARLVQRAGGGWRGAACGKEHRHGKHGWDQVQFFHGQSP
jgi:hypothetical protein